MGGKASRDKGARWERKVAEILTAAGFPSSRNARNGISTDDIAHTVPGVHIEAKHCERLEMPKWRRQAERDADGREVAIIYKQNRVDPRVDISLDHYLELLKIAKKPLAQGGTIRPGVAEEVCIGCGSCIYCENGYVQ